MKYNIKHILIEIIIFFILFSQVKHMVVNLDDSYGRRLLDEVHGPERITFSAGDDAADYTARNIRLSASGVKFEMVGRGFIQRLSLIHIWRWPSWARRTTRSSCWTRTFPTPP